MEMLLSLSYLGLLLLTTTSSDEKTFFAIEALVDMLFLCLSKIQEVVTNTENVKQVTVRKYSLFSKDVCNLCLSLENNKLQDTMFHHHQNIQKYVFHRFRLMSAGMIIQLRAYSMP
jgi:hypothetical protein